VELVLHAESKNASKVKDTLSADPVVSLASLIFKDGPSLGKTGFYVYISGLDSQCHKAMELVKDLVKVVEGKERDQIIHAIKEEQNKAVEGFGSIFGQF